MSPIAAKLRIRRDQAVQWIEKRCETSPDVAIVLGSGLGGLADKVEESTSFSFGELPGFSSSTASGHRGQLILGRLAGRNVIAMAGRLHRYEGWSNNQVAFPVQVMAALGASTLIVSNAAGGLNPKLRVGDLLIIRDHINLLGGLWRGDCHVSDSDTRQDAQRVAGCLGVGRRGDTYDEQLSTAARGGALAAGFSVTEGTYLATLGPTYETRAEYRMMRRLGADVAGMSTVPEVLAARHEGMRVLGISMVSNVANPDRPVVANHEEVLAAGRAAETKMESLVRGVLASDSTPAH